MSSRVHSSASLSDPSPQACFWLALIGSGCSIAIVALVFRGWTLEGPDNQWFPLLLSASLPWPFLSIIGGLRGRSLSRCSMVTCALAIIAGKVLALDLLGVSARASGDDALSPLETLYQALGTWSQQTPLVRYGNVLLLSLCPVLSYALPLFWEPLKAFLDRIAWPTLASLDSAEAPGGNTSSMPSARPRPPWLLTGWLVFVASLYVVNSQSDRTGFRMITLPGDRFHEANSLLGYSLLIGQRPVMAETVPAMEQVSWFSGGVRSDNNFRFQRAGYGFAGAQLAPFLGHRTSLLVINYLSWCICLYCVWCLSLSWSGYEAASVATACAAVGLGFAIHINDTIPHVPAFAMYFGGVLWMERIGIHRHRCNDSNHLQLGVLFGMMSLVYNVAQMLLFVYVLAGWRHQKPAQLLTTMLVTIAFRPTWRWILPALGINVQLVESQYFSDSIARWSEYLQTGLGTFAGQAALHALEVVTSFESPWIVLLAMVAAVYCQWPRSTRWLALSAVIAPVLACFVFSPVATARGYIVYSASLMAYVAIGCLFARVIKRGKPARLVALASLMLLLALQLFWSTAHYRHWIGPCKAYFLGWDDGAAYVFNEPTRAIAVTPFQKTPVAFGGDGEMADAGALALPATQSIARRSRLLSALSQGPFYAGLLLLGCTYWPQRSHRRRMALAIAGWSMTILLLSHVLVSKEPQTLPAVTTLPAAEPKLLTVELEVAAETRDAIRNATGSTEHRLTLRTGMGRGTAVRWFADGHPIPLQVDETVLWTLTDQADLQRIAQAKVWRFELDARSQPIVQFSGWQSNHLPGRKWSISDPHLPVPWLEVRVIDQSTGFPHLIVF